MKKVLFLAAILGSSLSMMAQNYNNIKNEVILQQYKKAKEDVDKGMGNSKFNSKPEAYILKATVYAGLANNDPSVKGTPEAAQLITEADAAFNKYKEMDPQMELLKDPTYQNAPISIYSALFSAGYKDYEAKNWEAGLEKFKKVLAYSDLLIDKKILTTPADTNSLLLAGILAESAGKKDEAINYYKRLADLKAKGDGFESIYRFVVNYYATNKDMENFEKYKAIGAELYPNSEYFKYDKVDFAIGLEDDLDKKIAALEQTIAGDPNNYKAVKTLGEIIYDTLYSRRPGAVPPDNAADLEPKMVNAFKKAIAMQPDDEYIYLLLGGHYINKADRLNEKREKLAADIKARTKPTAAPSKEDVAKREAMDKEYFDARDMAIEPYTQAAAIFDKKKADLSGLQKQQYRNVAGYLADIYASKRVRAKGKPADAAKFAAEEDKWNKVYDSIER